jgi:hypothetical protein
MLTYAEVRQAPSASSGGAEEDEPIFFSLCPDRIVHLDRDLPLIAAASFQWALLEFLLGTQYTIHSLYQDKSTNTDAEKALLDHTAVVAACESAVVSSGYGVVAAEVGGLTEQRTLRVKSGDTCEIWDTTGTATLDAGSQFTGTKVLALLVQVGAP